MELYLFKKTSVSRDAPCIYTLVDGQLCLAEIDDSLINESVPVFLVLGTAGPTQYIW